MRFWDITHHPDDGLVLDAALVHILPLDIGHLDCFFSKIRRKKREIRRKCHGEKSVGQIRETEHGNVFGCDPLNKLAGIKKGMVKKVRRKSYSGVEVFLVAPQTF